MASPQDVERASELAFRLFQIPAAMWHGAGSAFSQSMPLTTQTFSDVYIFTQLYVLVALIVCAFLFADAGVKLLQMIRLMLLGRLRPWGCIRRFMGFTEVSQEVDAEHKDVLAIHVPLTGYMIQIITMFSVDIMVAFPLSIFWITWVPILLLMTVVSCRGPKHYYTHLQSIRGSYTGIPRRAYEEEEEEDHPQPVNGHPSERDDDYDNDDDDDDEDDAIGSTKSFQLESDHSSIQFGLRNMNEEEYAEYKSYSRIDVDPSSHTTPFVFPGDEHED